MRILVVQESDWLTRGPHQQHQLFDRLAVQGHTIRVIDYDVDWAKEKKHKIIEPRHVFENVHRVIDDAKITVIRPAIIKLPILNYISLIFTHDKEIKRQVKEFKPDVIVGFGIINAWLACSIADTYKIPFIYYWIDVLHRLIPVKAMQLFGLTLTWSTLQHADRVLTINKSLNNYVEKCGAKNATIISAGVDFEKFKIIKERNEMRTELRIRNDDLVILYIGYIYHFAGLKDVARELINVNNKVKLVVVGDGEGYDDLRKIRDDLWIENQLILTGRMPYELMPSIINMADVCILPADVNEIIMQDIVPIKLYEYFAMSKSVICSKLSGVIAEFGKEHNGIIYVDKARDVIQTALWLKNRSMLEAYGKIAFNNVKSLSWNDIVLEFDKILIRSIVEKEQK